MKIDLMQLKFIDIKLRSMATEAEAHFGMELVVTSIYRMDDPGVHGTLPVRGLDIRCREMVVGQEIVKFVNRNWIYDPERLEKVCCMCHDVGRGLHLHLQTHPHTERRY